MSDNGLVPYGNSPIDKIIRALRSAKDLGAKAFDGIKDLFGGNKSHYTKGTSFPMETLALLQVDAKPAEIVNRENKERRDKIISDLHNKKTVILTQGQLGDVIRSMVNNEKGQVTYSSAPNQVNLKDIKDQNHKAPNNKKKPSRSKHNSKSDLDR